MPQLMPMNWWVSLFVIVLLIMVISLIYFDHFMKCKFFEKFNKVGYLNNWKW